MKKLAGLLAALALVAPVSACGGDSGGGDYCDQLADARDSADLDALGDNPAGLDDETFDDIRGRIDDIADAAPDDVKGDWENVGDALDEFKSILEDAGLSFDDLDTLSSGQMPEGLDPAKAQELVQRFSEWNTDELTESTEAIQQSAQDDCDINLDEGN